MSDRHEASRIDAFLVCDAGGKSLGIEISTPEQRYLVYENQEAMPGLRLGRFVEPIIGSLVRSRIYPA
jgi:hypothetical protein